MAPKPKVTEVSNQATGFAEQFMEALMGGNVGYATPLQRNIGNAYGSMISQGPQFYDQSKQFAALQDIFGQNLAQGSANVKEGFSMGGSRYGTSAATGLGRYTAQAGAQQNALLAQIGERSFESGMGRFLQMLGAGGNFSNQSLSPFVNMAAQGIVNPAVHMQENPWVTGINTVGNVAGNVLPFFDRTTGGPTVSGTYDDYYGMTNRPGHEPIPIGTRNPSGTGQSVANASNFVQYEPPGPTFGQPGHSVPPWMLFPGLGG